ncbi:MAG: 2-hydroxychromene-2-carboxylate isomerase [Proteobacteria bacterium]|nr:2-hydroxychromene-2-carboxylate isomerase [Pseudomonadota bacterium]
MAQQFENQGGAASSEPSRFFRWISSKVMKKMADPERLVKKRAKAEKIRLKGKLPHRVEYYHQVDDAYSHLTAQILQQLLDTYDIELVPMLAGPPTGKNAPELEMLLKYSLTDSLAVAPQYGLEFPTNAKTPATDLQALATRILAAEDAGDFPQAAVEVGKALWSANTADLESLAERYGCADPAEADASVAAGSERRDRLGHYSGAMFYYGDEWYWGVDRLYHLENRLIELNARKPGKSEPIVPRPEIDGGDIKDNGSLTLEFYSSLRSPYSSIIFDRTIQLVEDTGVKMVMRPVLPMVMRGVSLSRQKGFYIFMDTLRESRTLGLKWGKMYDPIGDPVRRAFSLYPWSREQGRDAEFLGAFLKAAFFDGVNTNTNAGLRSVVEKAGLSWQDAQAIVDNTDWEKELEENRLAMLDFGCWGVPSYRLFDGNGETVLAVWGQDRLWLVAREIKRLLAEK